MKRSEHITRAMLLGLKYLPKLGLYYKGGRDEGVQLDAITLKPIPWKDAIERIAGQPNGFVWYPEDPEDD